MSGTNLVAELRAEADECEGDYAIGDYPDACPALYERAADEIERLTAERDELAKQLGIGVQSQFDEGVRYESALADLRAERDAGFWGRTAARLTAELADLYAKLHESYVKDKLLQAERDRLKAALCGANAAHDLRGTRQADEISRLRAALERIERGAPGAYGDHAVTEVEWMQDVAREALAGAEKK